jgi:phenylpropionate dioxygenase-like ring-hydroxylating dioxygenase large terminal subunit
MPAVPPQSAPNAKQWVDAENGLVDRVIFSDPEIYRLEMERIFARAWNFVCHESQIPEPGDYFLNSIGEDRVIAVRNKAGGIGVFLNTCRHRGNAVCRAEQGNTRVFTCPYHGWSYDLDGALVGVPGFKEFYRGGLDRAEWGLARAAQVAIHRGFVFATLDPEAIPLDDYLGEVGRIGLGLIANRGDVEVVDGIQKNVIGCNWKLAVDNLYDWYHPPVSHRSASRSGFSPILADENAAYQPMNQMVLLGEYGHGIGGPRLSEEDLAAAQSTGGSIQGIESWRLAPDARESFGPAGVRTRGHPNIFPNVWVTLGGTQLCLRIPRGPLHTEFWWFTFVEKDLTPEARRRKIGVATHLFGPAGFLEQDDGENWDQSTKGTLGPAARRYPLHYAMGKGRDEVREDGGQKRIESVVNEHGQLWTYRAWADWIDAESWRDLVARHARVPSGVI